MVPHRRRSKDQSEKPLPLLRPGASGGLKWSFGTTTGPKGAQREQGLLKKSPWSAAAGKAPSCKEGSVWNKNA